MADISTPAWAELLALIYDAWPELVSNNTRVVFRSNSANEMNWTNMIEQFDALAGKGFKPPWVVVDFGAYTGDDEHSTLHARAKSMALRIYYCDAIGNGGGNSEASVQAKGELMRSRLEAYQGTYIQVLDNSAGLDVTAANPANEKFRGDGMPMTAAEISCNLSLGEVIAP